MDNRHVNLVLDNVRVLFPFEPYETQRDYMEGVVSVLNTSQNALLESPTGTGKTLSLLCSSLAWLQSNSRGPKSIIYYTSRTHMQLAQAAKEMKRTAYAKNPAVVIGSRTQMCLNQEVRDQASDRLINRACRNAIARNACAYYANYEQKLETMDMNQVHDIEDLSKFGRANQCCPYYASKKIAETKASLVFMPYNYLLDTSIKKSVQLKIDNSVIIFDEAHNIEGVLKDSASGTFTESGLKSVQLSCQKIPGKLAEVLNKERFGVSRSGFDPSQKRSSVIDPLAKQKDKPEKESKPNAVEELSEKLTTERLRQVMDCTERLKSDVREHIGLDETCGMEKILHVLRSAGIQYTTSSLLVETLDSMASFWSIAGVMDPATVAGYVSALTNLTHFISLLFPDDCLSVLRQADHEKRLSEFYSAHLKGIYDQAEVARRGPLRDWELNVWCLHPAVGLKRVMDSSSINGPRSLIVTSGTLAPMKPMERELEVQFKVIKELQHVIEEKQLKIVRLVQSPSSYSLVSNYEAAQRIEYPRALGETFLRIFKGLPYGTLVFFPSYALMGRVVRYWRQSKQWEQLNQASRLFVEGQIQAAFLADVGTYKKKISENHRAVFFGVCRGKLSEGVSLEGNYCRTVILTGLPFPSKTDPKVLATQKFHERRGDPRGNLWYSQQMTRALNQTIGRVIRSKTDFGLLIFCDPRFSEYKFSLSQWTRRFFPPKESQWPTVETEIKDFFLAHNIDASKIVAKTPAYDPSPLMIATPSPGQRQQFPPRQQHQQNPRQFSQRQQFGQAHSTPRTSHFSPSLSQSQSQPKSQPPSQCSKQTQYIVGPIRTSQSSRSSDSSQLRRVSSQTSSGSVNYSVINEYRDKSQPCSYKCYICKKMAKNPQRINCKCARVGCKDCLRILSGKDCGTCGTMLKRTTFKPLLFKSSFHGNQRYPPPLVGPPLGLR